MSIPEPLFGLLPVLSSVPQVEAVCVNHYPGSATRPHIWEGFQVAHTKIVNANTPGKVWLGGDFVVDREDPNYAQVHLRVPADYPKNESLLDLLSWLNDKEQTEKLACDLSALVEFPPDDPKIHLIKEFEEIILDSFTAHGDTGKKGFPILPVP